MGGWGGGGGLGVKVRTLEPGCHWGTSEKQHSRDQQQQKKSLIIRSPYFRERKRREEQIKKRTKKCTKNRSRQYHSHLGKT